MEKFIKKQKSRKLIEKLIGGTEVNGILAQLVRVPQVCD
jgi:putative endonuclease